MRSLGCLVATVGLVFWYWAESDGVIGFAGALERVPPAYRAEARQGEVNGLDGYRRATRQEADAVETLRRRRVQEQLRRLYRQERLRQLYRDPRLKRKRGEHDHEHFWTY